MKNLLNNNLVNGSYLQNKQLDATGILESVSPTTINENVHVKSLCFYSFKHTVVTTLQPGSCYTYYREKCMCLCYFVFLSHITTVYILKTDKKEIYIPVTLCWQNSSNL